MADDQIRYDILAQDALRGVVRKVLSEVARTGLPGEHHFYITIATRAPGVRVSSRLASQYPEDMTIILQHQFWDLSVTEHAFEVGLSFNGVPERLLVPFTAVKAFIDPSVQFALQFEPALPEDADQPDLSPEDLEEPELPGFLVDEETVLPDDDVRPAPESRPAAEGSAEVVSLEAFRKKT